MTENIENSKNEVLEQKLTIKKLSPLETSGKKSFEIDIQTTQSKGVDGTPIQRLKEKITDYYKETSVKLDAQIKNAKNLGVHIHLSGEEGEVRAEAAAILETLYPPKITKKDYGHEKVGVIYRVNGETCIDFDLPIKYLHLRPSGRLKIKADELQTTYNKIIYLVSKEENALRAARMLERLVDEDKVKVNASNIMAVATLMAKKGDRLTIATDADKYSDKVVTEIFNYMTGAQFINSEKEN